MRACGIFSVLLVAACGADDTQCKQGVDCDVTLAPPSSGFQLRVEGPALDPGTERLQCFWRTVPMDADVTNITVHYNLGSHHLDIFTVPYTMPDGDFDCSDPTQWGVWPSQTASGLPSDAAMPAMLVGFQNATVDWTLPDGVGYSVHAGQQLMIQSHYANVTDQATPVRMLDLINFEAASSPMPKHAETLFDEDTNLFIPAGSTTTFTRICEFPQTVDLIAMFGHFHSRGKDLSVWSYDVATKQQGQLLYENTTWTDPPWTTTDTWGGSVQTSAIRMTSTYTNATDHDITWGPYVGQNEHFETYAMFYPSLGLDPYCVCHREGELGTCP